MKGQSEIVSALLIILIAIALTTTALMWGLPLLRKRQDSVLVEKINAAFDPQRPRCLQNVIKNVANNGGSEKFFVDTEGIWTVNETENSISFSFFALACDKALNMWIGENCPENGTGKAREGTIGVDEPFVKCVFATKSGDGFDITYKLWFRDMVSEDGNTVWRIQMKIPEGGLNTCSCKSLVVRREDGVSEETIDGKRLIKTEVEIVLG